MIYLFAIHTTCALTTANLDPGAEKNFLTAFEKIKPKAYYLHPHNPENFIYHFLSLIVDNFIHFDFNS